jgi:hypothetical protein
METTKKAFPVKLHGTSLIVVYFKYFIPQMSEEKNEVLSLL